MESSGWLMRLKRREDFQTVAARGVKWVTPGIVVQALARPEAHEFRLGFTVSGKVGNAVVRNRARRRLKSLCDGIFRETGPLPGWDMVLIGRTATIERDFDALRQDFLIALKKLKVWRA